MEKDIFVTLVEGIRKEFERELAIHDSLTKYGIYISDEREDGLTHMFEKLIKKYYSDYDELIFDYCYPVLDERPLVLVNGESMVITNAEMLYDYINKTNDDFEEIFGEKEDLPNLFEEEDNE